MFHEEKKRAKKQMKKFFKHRSKRTPADERLYHGSCLPDEFMDGRRDPTPVMSATTAGPLPGVHGRSCGAWGTLGRSCRRRKVPLFLSGFGVAAVDGRKRSTRGGASEDAFSAVLDILSHQPEESAPHSTYQKNNSTNSAKGKGMKSSSSVKLNVNNRVFHLFGVFDGHRSNHAARFCTEALGEFIIEQLPNTIAAIIEEKAIKEALSKAICSVDEEFCKRRWVSLVRDNGKKFYVTFVQEVGPKFNIYEWNTYPLESVYRNALGRAAKEHGKRSGISCESELSHYVNVQQDFWKLYKKELYPGAALCAVLIDEERGKIYCANVGDSGALMYHALGVETSKKDVLNRNDTEKTTENFVNHDIVDKEIHFGPGSGSLPVRRVKYASSKIEEFQAWVSPKNSCQLLPPGSWTLLSRAHKPSQMEELKRVCSTEEGFVEVHGQNVTVENAEEVARLVAIAQAHGKKALYRINRDISLSRAIGDQDLKRFGVCATPEVTVHSINQIVSSNSSSNNMLLFIVLATDGLWDVISPLKCAALLQEASDITEASMANLHCGQCDDTSNNHATFENGEQQYQHSGRILHAEKAEIAARLIVDSAHAVYKNNDDVTAVVATLMVTK
eukprot:GSMAST32.ASY1.ANO1.989.1 assembled CDS